MGRGERMRALALALLMALPMAFTGSPVAAQMPDLERLRQGGFVFYFRHADTDFSGSDRIAAAGDWRSCDPERMRQLSDSGRGAAAATGAAIRKAGIPVGRIVASEYCRAVQTAEGLGLGPVEAGTAIFNMRARDFVGGRDALLATARDLLNTPPPEGSNTIAVAHGNLGRALLRVSLVQGEAAVLRPGGSEGPEVLGVLGPEDWARLAGRK